MLPKGNFKQMVKGLNRLGFNSYDQYLNSNVWRLIKERANKTKTGIRNKCFICFGKGSLWHHKTYKHLGNEKASHDIVRLCNNCHEISHNQSGDLWYSIKRLRKTSIRNSSRLNR